MIPGHSLAGLDHLRALAIILVLLFHYRLFGHPDWVLSSGVFAWTGVDLFFVLSGYLISVQLFASIAQGRKISMGEFYIKRTFRIIPAYLATLALYFLIPAFNEYAGKAPFWRFITFTQNFGLDQRYSRSFSHAWSLCVEEQFYLVLPLLIILMLFLKAGKKAFILLPAIFIAGFIIRAFVYDNYVVPVKGSADFNMLWVKAIYYPTYNRLDGLLAGVGIAAINVFKPGLFKRITKYGNITLLISIVLIVIAYFMCLDRYSFLGTVFGFPMVSIAYGVLVLAALSPGCVLYKFRSKITASVATLSYSIYLTHKGIFHLTQVNLGKLGIDLNSNLMILPCLLFALLGAVIMRFAVEKPFLKIRERILANMRKKKMEGKLKITVG